MRSAEVVALAYFVYLAAVGLVLGRARAASAITLVAVSAIEAAFLLVDRAWLDSLRHAWPLLLLFIGYRVAGLLYERPDTALEARLLAVDARVTEWTRGLVARAAPAFTGVRVTTRAAAWLEAAYLGVYVVIPLGALVVWMAGPERALDRFWTVVLVSGFACYGALPWIQTRPPRIVERSSFTMAERGSSLRRLNLAILERGSVGVNTLPSGHAATAVATALAVVSCTQAVGAVFVAAAALIAVATIVGRYHYAVDTVLGVLVGVAAWAMFPAS